MIVQGMLDYYYYPCVPTSTVLPFQRRCAHDFTTQQQQQTASSSLSLSNKKAGLHQEERARVCCHTKFRLPLRFIALLCVYNATKVAWYSCLVSLYLYTQVCKYTVCIGKNFAFIQYDLEIISFLHQDNRILA